MGANRVAERKGAEVVMVLGTAGAVQKVIVLCIVETFANVDVFWRGKRKPRHFFQNCIKTT